MAKGSPPVGKAPEPARRGVDSPGGVSAGIGPRREAGRFGPTGAPGPPGTEGSGPRPERDNGGPAGGIATDECVAGGTRGGSPRSALCCDPAGEGVNGEGTTGGMPGMGGSGPSNGGALGAPCGGPAEPAGPRGGTAGVPNGAEETTGGNGPSAGGRPGGDAMGPGPTGGRKLPGDALPGRGPSGGIGPRSGDAGPPRGADGGAIRAGADGAEAAGPSGGSGPRMGCSPPCREALGGVKAETPPPADKGGGPASGLNGGEVGCDGAVAGPEPVPSGVEWAPNRGGPARGGGRPTAPAVEGDCSSVPQPRQKRISPGFS